MAVGTTAPICWIPIGGPRFHQRARGLKSPPDRSEWLPDLLVAASTACFRLKHWRISVTVWSRRTPLLLRQRSAVRLKPAAFESDSSTRWDEVVWMPILRHHPLR